MPSSSMAVPAMSSKNMGETPMLLQCDCRFGSVDRCDRSVDAPGGEGVSVYKLTAADLASGGKAAGQWNEISAGLLDRATKHMKISR